jgi:hypothetical protein
MAPREPFAPPGTQPDVRKRIDLCLAGDGPQFGFVGYEDVGALQDFS